MRRRVDVGSREYFTHMSFLCNGWAIWECSTEISWTVAFWGSWAIWKSVRPISYRNFKAKPEIPEIFRKSVALENQRELTWSDINKYKAEQVENFRPCARWKRLSTLIFHIENLNYIMSDQILWIPEFTLISNLYPRWKPPQHVSKCHIDRPVNTANLLSPTPLSTNLTHFHAIRHKSLCILL